MEKQARAHPVETHEQFLQRASRVFPVEASVGWGVFERTVFNYLVGRLVLRHGYAGVSDAMLWQALDEMREIVGRAQQVTH